MLSITALLLVAMVVGIPVLALMVWLIIGKGGGNEQ